MLTQYSTTALHAAVFKGTEAVAEANPKDVLIENKDGNTNQPTKKRGYTENLQNNRDREEQRSKRQNTGYAEAFQTNNNANTTNQPTTKRGHTETLQNNRDREEQHSKKQNTNSR